ncbi:PhzF family phenazine biosynthesis protein [Maribacter polysaccharolyticus]|uniref:PhzF family phenazine biosynthesis protein n=1 Tax=Maribacter polysaccharolyticus TaxID=3020831 RepID=UPI00237F876A|nr:PhzF family phenazine biosynthesis protein [Maribacter polysaccharolyticus]MDE3742306.1 PhzF family phenazine biosynthesis protein [Maribacter polysaccharolyticus]
MKLRIFQIDAFAERMFTGNPAAVCILDSWIDDNLMQQIAAENNLAETVFAVKNNDRYAIRWFTPEIEVDLCGHATLATAFVLFNHYLPNEKHIEFFSSRSGSLRVEKSENGYLTLDFPADDLTAVDPMPQLYDALGATPEHIFKGKTDYLLVYNNQDEIKDMDPNFFLLNQIDARGIIVTAKGEEVDFVSRFFAPQAGINEDPVTGSAHTSLTPYWSKILGKDRLTAKQLSKRGGELICENHGTRIKISGKAVSYLIGEIEV